MKFEELERKYDLTEWATKNKVTSVREMVNEVPIAGVTYTHQTIFKYYVYSDENLTIRLSYGWYGAGSHCDWYITVKDRVNADLRNEEVMEAGNSLSDIIRSLNKVAYMRNLDINFKGLKGTNCTVIDRMFVTCRVPKSPDYGLDFCYDKYFGVNIPLVEMMELKNDPKYIDELLNKRFSEIVYEVEIEANHEIERAKRSFELMTTLYSKRGLPVNGKNKLDTVLDRMI